MRKKKMSIIDFKNFCKNERISRFVFYSGNQPEEYMSQRFYGEYNKIDIGVSPNFITFWDDKKYMSLRQIKYIMKWKDYPNIFDIVCKDKKGERSYTIIAE